MRECVRRNLGKRMTATQAIDWAMSGENTTKTGDIPGGLGLKILRKFITLNGGKLVIVSDAGYWGIMDGKEQPTVKAFEHPFPGTVVSVEVNTNDAHSYRLAGEPDGSEE